MKSTHIWITLLAISLLFNLMQVVYFATRTDSRRVEQIETELSYQKGLSAMHEEMNLDLYEKIEKMLAMEDTFLSDTLTLRNPKGEAVLLGELMQNGPRLVLYYSEVNCRTCINENLEKMKALAGAAGEEHILILASGGRQQDMQQLKRLNRFDSDVLFQSGKLHLPFEMESAPLLFWLDNSLRVSRVFIPDKEHRQSTDYYFSLIQQHFLAP
ncbi:MAG: hypothetical protein AB7C90_03675 [Bacteroidales bacterium]